MSDCDANQDEDRPGVKNPINRSYGMILLAVVTFESTRVVSLRDATFLLKTIRYIIEGFGLSTLVQVEVPGPLSNARALVW